MIKIKRMIAAVALSIFAFSAVGCDTIQKTPEAIKNTVLAEGNGIKITKGDVDEIADPYLKQQFGEGYENNPGLTDQIKQLKGQALDMLVEQKIMEKKAEELGVTPSDDEVNTEVQKYMDLMKESYGGEEGFNNALQDAGLTLEDFIEDATKGNKSDMIFERVTNEIFKDINIADEDINTYYEENKDGFGEANAEHILVSDEEKAKEIRERIVNGEDFAVVAKETSEEPAAAETGGDLGVIEYNSMQYDQDFLAGFKVLKEGEISEPVRSQFGYHVIKATNVKNKTLEESKETIKTMLENQEKDLIYKTSMEQWKNDYKIEVHANKL